MASNVKDIVGKGDANLIQAAAMHGQSSKQADLTGYYGAKAVSFANLVGGIKKVRDAIYKKHTDLGKTITESANILSQKLNVEGGIYNTAANNLHMETVQGYRDRLEEINPLTKEGKEERRTLELEIQKYHNTMSANQDIFKFTIDNFANNDVLHDIGDDRVELFKVIAEDMKNNTNKANATYKDGDIVYEYDGKKITMSEIQRAFTVNNKEYAAEFMKNSLIPVAQLGQTKGGVATAEDLSRWKQENIRNIKNDDQRRIIANNNFGQSYSFQEMLNLQGFKTDADGNVTTDPGAIKGILQSILDLGVDVKGYGEDGEGADITSGAQLNLNPTTEDEIKALQTELLSLGYDLGNFGPNNDGVDGKIGDKTRAAIEDYKKLSKSGYNLDGYTIPMDIESRQYDPTVITDVNKLLEALSKPENKDIYNEVMIGYLGEVAFKDFYKQGVEQMKGGNFGDSLNP